MTNDILKIEIKHKGGFTYYEKWYIPHNDETLKKAGVEVAAYMETNSTWGDKILKKQIILKKCGQVSSIDFINISTGQLFSAPIIDSSTSLERHFIELKLYVKNLLEIGIQNAMIDFLKLEIRTEKSPSFLNDHMCSKFIKALDKITPEACHELLKYLAEYFVEKDFEGFISVFLLETELNLIPFYANLILKRKLSKNLTLNLLKINQIKSDLERQCQLIFNFIFNLSPKAFLEILKLIFSYYKDFFIFIFIEFDRSHLFADFIAKNIINKSLSSELTKELLSFNIINNQYQERIKRINIIKFIIQIQNELKNDEFFNDYIENLFYQVNAIRNMRGKYVKLILSAEKLLYHLNKKKFDIYKSYYDQFDSIFEEIPIKIANLASCPKKIHVLGHIQNYYIKGDFASTLLFDDTGCIFLTLEQKKMPEDGEFHVIEIMDASIIKIDTGISLNLSLNSSIQVLDSNWKFFFSRLNMDKHMSYSSSI